MNAITYNSVNPYETQYGSAYNYIPFKSTSSNMQGVNYNTVKPLNADGTVSIEYTTYKGVYKPKYANRGLGDIDEDDQIIGELVPIGDPNIFIILLLVLPYLYIKRMRKHFFETL